MSAPLLPNPPTGSANPAASLSSLWAYLSPALDHIMRSPTNNDSKAPSVDLEFYSGIHSACYNYFTSSRMDSSTKSDSLPTGTELYDQLDKYFADVARDIMLGSPHDDSSLIHYLIPCFNRYTAGAQSVNRLLNYVNRHYVKRAVDEDRGWLSVGDVLEHVAKTMHVLDNRERITSRMKEKRMEELKKWGFVDGSSNELLARAEAAAEAASPPDRIIPISSLAHRRFRIEVLEPLLSTPKFKYKKVRNKIPKPNTGPPPVKGRLARSIDALLESPTTADERSKLMADMSKMFAVTGIRIDHPLRKMADKYQPPPP